MYRRIVMKWRFLGFFRALFGSSGHDLAEVFLRIMFCVSLFRLLDLETETTVTITECLLRNHVDIPLLDYKPVAQYSRPWYKKGFFYPSDYCTFTKCSTCNFVARNDRPNSTPRDLLLTGMFKRAENIVPMLRTLRSTGSKCSVVVFTDIDIYKQLPPRLLEFVRDCGCTIVDTGVLFSTERRYLFMLRNSAAYDFLRARHYLFDRVLLIDLFDTVFQGDPFMEDLKDDLIGFSEEHGSVVRGNHIKGCEILCGKKTAHKYLMWKPMINCGTVVGTIHSMMVFLEQFFALISGLSQENYVKLIETNYPDQAIVNVLVRTGILERCGLRVKLFDHTEQFASMFRTHKLQYDFRMGSYRPNASMPYPLVLHNFDRTVHEFCWDLLRVCPQEFPIFGPYTRCEQPL